MPVVGKPEFNEEKRASWFAHKGETLSLIHILGKIEVEGGNLDQYRTFYSCLYRSLLFPRKFYELDAAGQTVHYSPYNGQVLPGYMYTDTGFWAVSYTHLLW